MKVSLSVKHARAIADAVGTLPLGGMSNELARAIDALAAALKPRPKSSQAKRTESRRRAKLDEARRIREAVFARAGGRCEMRYVDGDRCALRPTEMDHFFGRGKTRQTVENCWALCGADHRAKTLNTPSAEFWLRSFKTHAEMHGYATEASRAEREAEWRAAKKAGGAA